MVKIILHKMRSKNQIFFFEVSHNINLDRFLEMFYACIVPCRELKNQCFAFHPCISINPLLNERMIAYT